MDIESRLAVLEQNLMERLAAEIAQDAVLDALIATHPDQRAVRDVYQAISAYRLTQFGDLGFEQQAPAKSVANVFGLLREQFDAWQGKLSADI
ncbi:hypothetical protein B8X02_03450 [Stenotrophomonas rhizophila]|jgi:hypothetical protein|uniref:hypothetical protein n=1 Tax=Stenotrophomonas TaxID=40323 RepID=UPI00083AC605|nr:MULTISPECIES: hypothetical protein [Stenotrophomonas]MDQ1062156.1 hypothetical protein [Stenotrophomonas sp. SORGH_AS_0282]MDQ1189488.1 hypothetical protein [Stenotrophomonas sp. SORGH_AS_0282]PAK93875.1 hypothetical protein B8X02_03450 [Stenotrophomonas rhizophila]